MSLLTHLISLLTGLYVCLSAVHTCLSVSSYPSVCLFVYLSLCISTFHTCLSVSVCLTLYVCQSAVPTSLCLCLCEYLIYYSSVDIFCLLALSLSADSVAAVILPLFRQPTMSADTVIDVFDPKMSSMHRHLTHGSADKMASKQCMRPADCHVVCGTGRLLRTAVYGTRLRLYETS